MPYLALTCPQCGGALPLQAWWRMVSCPYCAAVVTRSEDVVDAGRFHQAMLAEQLRKVRPVYSTEPLGGPADSMARCRAELACPVWFTAAGNTHALVCAR